MPAAWAGVAVAAGSAIAGAVGSGSQSSSIQGGQDAANRISQQAIDTGTGYYKADQANYAPYIGAGQNALSSYGNLLGINGQDAANSSMAAFQASPGYGYQVQQGLKAVDAGAASQGLLRSGATLRAEQTLGSNLANQDFTNYMGRLNQLSGYGLSGAQLANQSTTTMDNLLNGQATNQQSTLTSGAASQANITGNETKNFTNALNSAGGDIANYGSQNGWFNSNSTNTMNNSLNNIRSGNVTNTGAGYTAPDSVTKVMGI